VVDRLLAGQDVLAVMPTGSGKSLCYQLPAVLRDGVALVVSPLIALMKDQVDQLHGRGILEAASIHSGMSGSEVKSTLRAAREGRFRLLYVAPERFGSEAFMASFDELRVGMFVVDEAHCVSAWGHDFRPDYLQLANFVQRARPAPLLALTATATASVRDEIAVRLGMCEPYIIVNSFDRPNLTLEVQNTSIDRKTDVVERACRTAEGCAIVYVARRADAEAVAHDLTHRGLAAVPYHAGMEPAKRTRNQDRFLSGKSPVIVATMAFGMGIDKPDVRLVLHYQHPGSLESYYQEAGRAGRDGEPARCLVLYNRRDSAIQEFFIRGRYPNELQVRDVHRLLADGVPPEDLVRQVAGLTQERRNVALAVLAASGCLETDPDSGFLGSKQGRDTPLDMSAMRLREKRDWDRLQAMLDYLTLGGCRRRRLLGYFGDDWSEDRRCETCDGCTAPRREEPRRVVASGTAPRKSTAEIEAAIQRFLAEGPAAKLSRTAIGQFLVGSATKAVTRNRLGNHPLFGSLEGMSRKTVVAVLDKMMTATVAAQARSRSLATAPLPSADEQVPRKTGLAILALLDRWPDGLTRSGIANVLRGAAWASPVKDLGEVAFPEFGALAGVSYDELVRHVDRMTAKGYCEQATRGRVHLSSAGRETLECSRKHNSTAPR
jgi:ATP-dependent DNA helicase RecQ